MNRSGTGSGWLLCSRAGSVAATAIMLAASAFAGSPSAAAIAPPVIDPAAVPPNSPPGPDQPMRQSSYCTEVGVLPGTNFGVPPKYMDILNMPEAWQFGRGAGVTVAVIDTGVTPHRRLPHLAGGGDYVMAGGDGLSDCDAHGTIVASMIAAAPANSMESLPPAPPPKPLPFPTQEPPPPPPPPQTVTLKPGPPQTVTVVPAPPSEPPGPPPPPWMPQPPAPPPAAPGAAKAGQGRVVAPSYSGGGHVVAVDDPTPLAPSPAPPAPPPGPPSDAFVGIAPDVDLISIRQTSAAFTPKDPYSGDQDPQTRKNLENIHTMARAIVHAADMGASVINISDVTCMSARNVPDQPDLGAAVRYAAVDKDAVIVAAAGDTSKRDCKQNPGYDPLQPNDPRDWSGVNTVVTPAWFDDYVLTVGAVDANGAPMTNASVAGPWVSIAAPGTDIEGLSSRDEGLINAINGPDNSLLVPTGTSFSTAIVSGVAALVRAKYPKLSAHQVINRLTRTARPPARGVDNQVGHGIVDPVAALTWDVPDGPVSPPKTLSAPLKLAPPPPERYMTPIWVAGGGLAAVLLVVGAVFGGAVLMRRSGGRK